MKEQILRLRSEGKSYKDIVKELGCSISTVAYHCNKTSKAKGLVNQTNNPNKRLIQQTGTFRGQVSKFSREFENTTPFTYKDVLNKFGKNTHCYLTGTPITLVQDLCHFDHIIPVAKGGSNTLDNLGITIPNANKSKSDMTLDEYLELCEKVLVHHGYIINKP